MTKHKRSDLSIQRRMAKRFVSANSFHDRQKQEDVNIKTSAQISEFLAAVIECPVHQEVPGSFVRGEVLSNGYGTGTLQR